jgi:hypothetical protein
MAVSPGDITDIYDIGNIKKTDGLIKAKETGINIWR